ncbi:Gfo/Idh/MocA family protein [Occallatibacter savannae]|uniref:Gfo/Idh/MocA family protein n=1 Tax=Occallatibacter savannae TaxID=1002691 RepID=UPI000D6911D7|nr:Gfo/Idh/MocA family oxidoreductase [Occallatibacter savannae]
MTSESFAPEPHSWSRRRFMQASLATAAIAGAVETSPAQESPLPADRETMADVPFQKREPRVGLIGVGGRGTSLLGNLLAANAQIVALCDVVKEKADHAAGLVVAAGQKRPELFTDGPQHFESLVAKSDVDFVIAATPWRWHAPMALAAMAHGKDVAVEVPAVVSLEDCWRIVRASEETRKHCLMLENCCYGYNETLVLRMIHAGEFGEILYGEGAYLHDLRDELFSHAGEGLWRRAEHTRADGNLYPTHGLGPVANYMRIQRGDRFDHLVSMSSPQRGLDAYRKQKLQPDDPRQRERYVCGDLNTSLIKTAAGRTITVKHAVSTPHPYSRINQIAGTKAIFEDYPPRIYIDGMNKDEAWGTIDGYKQYQHPLWAREGEIAQKVGGHGGMDFIMIYRLLQCIREGLPPDMDVYDAAAWSAVGPLSVESVAQGSAPIEVPDFTRGKWQSREISRIATQA